MILLQKSFILVLWLMKVAAEIQNPGQNISKKVIEIKQSWRPAENLDICLSLTFYYY